MDIEIIELERRRRAARYVGRQLELSRPAVNPAISSSATFSQMGHMVRPPSPSVARRRSHAGALLDLAVAIRLSEVYPCSKIIMNHI